MWKLRVLFCTVVLSLPTQALAARMPVSIDIFSSWASLGSGGKAEAHIKRTRQGYVADGKPMNTAAVVALVDALDAPELDHPDLANLGITPEAMALAAKTGDDWNDFATASPAQITLYRRALTDPAIQRRIVDMLFNSVTSDYMPYASITLVYDDASTLRAETYSTQPFALPWMIKSGDGGQKLTFNADITRAMSSLLPGQGGYNRRAMVQEIKFLFRAYIHPQWQLQAVEDHAAPVLAMIRAHYIVDGAEIGGGPLSDDKDDTQHLTLTLRRTDLPATFSDIAVLAYHDEKADGIDTLFKRGQRYEALALSPPWLRRRLADETAPAVYLYYKDGRSLDDAQLAEFTADMHASGRNALAAEIRREQDDVAVLLSGPLWDPERWLVLPDRRMVLWRYNQGSKTPLLPEAADGMWHGCAGGTGFTMCPGFIISPGGKVRK